MKENMLRVWTEERLMVLLAPVLSVHAIEGTYINCTGKLTE